MAGWDVHWNPSDGESNHRTKRTTPAEPPGLSLLGMPFLVPGSRTMTLRAPPVSHAVFIVNVYQPSDTSQDNFPASPPQSECESVTPRSPPYLNTPPILGADIFDAVPFSVRTHRRAYQCDPKQLVVAGVVLGVP